MADTTWQRQTPDKPLFPDILWSRPENKRSAGKLLIIGGNLHGFTAVSQAYSNSLRAGVGTARAVLPDSLAKTLGKVFPEAEFAPSNPSGSFARSALDTLLDSAAWADGVLLAGDFGKNSETAILLEGFIQKYSGSLTFTGDSLDYFLDNALLTNRANAALVLEFSQLQKLMAVLGQAIKSSMDLVRLVDALNEWTKDIEAGICTVFSGQVVCAYRGRVVTTSLAASASQLSAHVAVWQLWQPAKVFEALASAAYACPREQ